MAAKDVVVHALFFAIFAAALHHNIANIFIDGITNSYGGRFKFLTFINLILSAVYYGIALFYDAAKLGLWRNKEANGRGLIIRCRDSLFGSLIFPVSFIVTFAFWGVMAVDSELMLPSNLRPMIPVNGWYNHAAHTAPLLVAFGEMFVIKHPKFPSRRRGCIIYTTFCVTYLSWIMWIALKANIWVYPVLKVLTWPGRAAFLGTAYMFGLCCFFIGCFINSRKTKLQIEKGE